MPGNDAGDGNESGEPTLYSTSFSYTTNMEGTAPSNDDGSKVEALLKLQDAERHISDLEAALERERQAQRGSWALVVPLLS
jgi:hypothetical protein